MPNGHCGLSVSCMQCYLWMCVTETCCWYITVYWKTLWFVCCATRWSYSSVECLLKAMTVFVALTLPPPSSLSLLQLLSVYSLDVLEIIKQWQMKMSPPSSWFLPGSLCLCSCSAVVISNTQIHFSSDVLQTALTSNQTDSVLPDS